MNLCTASFVCLLSLCGMSFSQSTDDAFPILQSSPAKTVQQGKTHREPQLEQGLEILLRLHNVLDSVRDRASADKASAQIYKLLAELTSWGQQTSAITKTEKESAERTEESYLRRFKQLNDRLEAQALRLSAADWYSSVELQRALIQFVQNTR